MEHRPSAVLIPSAVADLFNSTVSSFIPSGLNLSDAVIDILERH